MKRVSLFEVDADFPNGDTAVSNLPIRGRRKSASEEPMAWEKPKFEEICCGFEVTMYLPAEL